MRFKIRPGFRMFSTPDAAATFEAGGPKTGIRPVDAGRVVRLSAEQVYLLLCRGRLGALEPVDDEARKVYGNTQPLVSDVFEHPERYAVRPEPERQQFVLAGAR